MGVFLHQFGHLPSPLCEGCGVPDTQGHLLLDCPRWAFHCEQLREWLQSVCTSDTAVGGFPPIWGWGFLVGTPGCRVWLNRFLAAVQPHWTMRHQLQSEFSDIGVEGV